MNKNFNPNLAAPKDSGIFGLFDSFDEAKVIYLPVPWEATTSYGGGTANGPSAILKASHQLDLYDVEVEKPYEAGLHLVSESKKIHDWNSEARALAQEIIEVGGDIGGDANLKAKLSRVNELSKAVNEWVYSESRNILNNGKILAVIGGDHSVPFGAIKAAAEKFGPIGILHFDAHSDTRDAYEGFQYSHASIMRNVLDEVPQVEKIVQVGIRDFCEEEVTYMRAKGSRSKIYFDQFLNDQKMEGVSWAEVSKKIVNSLPEKVWISFDIDGLDPKYCPHTGTPVAGGLELFEAVRVIADVARSGRKIVGFDLNEVAPGEDSEWDANVGMRLLYKLTAWTLASQKLAKTL